MKRVLPILGAIALLCTIAPSALFAMQWISLELVKGSMLFGAVLWFSTAAFWMKAE